MGLREVESQDGIQHLTVTVFLYSHLFGRLVPQNYVQPLPPSSLGVVSDTPSHQCGMASGRTEGSQSS